MKITVENASVHLLDELYMVEQQCFKQEAFSKRQIGYLLTDYNTLSLVARVDGEVAGFIVGRINVERESFTGHILTIDVASFHRQKGIATQLLSQLEAMFKEKGVKECRLEVREDNAVALSLYLKSGYKEVAKLERYYRDAHGLYLRKILE